LYNWLLSWWVLYLVLLSWVPTFCGPGFYLYLGPTSFSSGLIQMYFPSSIGPSAFVLGLEALYSPLQKIFLDKISNWFSTISTPFSNFYTGEWRNSVSERRNKATRITTPPPPHPGGHFSSSSSSPKKFRKKYGSGPPDCSYLGPSRYCNCSYLL
jgi:hypothetical protein